MYKQDDIQLRLKTNRQKPDNEKGKGYPIYLTKKQFTDTSDEREIVNPICKQ